MLRNLDVMSNPAYLFGPSRLLIKGAWLFLLLAGPIDFFVRNAIRRLYLPEILFCLVVFLISVTSLPAHAAETSLFMDSQPGDYIGVGQQYLYTPTNGTFTAQKNYDNGISISFNTPAYEHWWYLDFSAPNNQPLTVGAYEGATRFPFQEPAQPGLSVVGDGRGCNMLTGRFE
ncbi:MAG TPA: hypothetical protein VIL61_05380, partial [Nitrospiria bacterium]